MEMRLILIYAGEKTQKNVNGYCDCICPCECMKGMLFYIRKKSQDISSFSTAAKLKCAFASFGSFFCQSSFSYFSPGSSHYPYTHLLKSPSTKLFLSHFQIIPCHQKITPFSFFLLQSAQGSLPPYLKIKTAFGLQRSSQEIIKIKNILCPVLPLLHPSEYRQRYPILVTRRPTE